MRLKDLSQRCRRWFGQAVALANYDFCPWANRFVYWLKQPIGWFLVAALASALIGAFLATQGWLLFAVLCAVVTLGVSWPWLAMRGLSSEISFGRRRGYEGETQQVTLTITNRWPWPVWGLLLERGLLDPSEADSQDNQPTTVTALARVGGWSRTHFEFPFTPPRRGVYPHEPPQLATGFPFGMWMSRREVTTAGELLVWPQRIDLESIPLLQSNGISPMGSLIDVAGNDGDILAARHYRDGDSLRQIHWSQTARRDTLIVNERQTGSRLNVIVSLDGPAFEVDSKDARDELDWALRIVGSLCREFHGHACQVTCDLGGRRHPVAPSTASLHKLYDQLARFQPCGSSDSTSLAANSSTSALLVIVTTTSGWINVEAANARKVRAVVLDSGADSNAIVAPAWLRLDLRRDLKTQFQKQWETRCHDDWCYN